MNITFLIGNGFDISLGMESSYSSFYKYLQDNELLQHNIFIKLINKDIDKWSDFERMLGILTTYSDWSETIKENQKKLAFDISDSEIEEIIKMIENEEEIPERFVSDLDRFQDEFRLYLLKKQELVMERLAAEIDCSSIIADTINEIYNDFHGFEENYFRKNIEDSIIENDYNDIINTLRVNINFLNFNYTDTVSYLIEHTDKSSITKFFKKNIVSDIVKVQVNIKEEHIHSTLEEGMYLGIDSEKQCINEFFYDVSDMEELIKPSTKDYFLDNSVQNIQDIISSTDLLIVFGMSFGETDQIYWDMIKDTMQYRKKTFQLLLNIYNKNYSDEFISVHQRSYRRNQNILRNIFFDRVEFSDNSNKKSAMRRTHPILNSNKIFNFNKKITEKSNPNEFE